MVSFDRVVVEDERARLLTASDGDDDARGGRRARGVRAGLAVTTTMMMMMKMMMIRGVIRARTRRGVDTGSDEDWQNIAP